MRGRWHAVLVPLAALLVAAGAARAQAIDEADAAWQKRDLDTAARLYQQRLARDSSDGFALHRLALILAWSEKYDQSLAVFDRMLARYPGALEASVDRARVLAWKHDLKGARDALDAVLAIHPGDALALRLRAQVESWAGDYDAAVTTYQQMLTVAPGDRSVQQERARVLSWATHYRAAADAYRHIVEADTADLQARLDLAQALAWSRQLDSASVVYGSVLRRDAANLEAQRGAARTASWRGRLREAEAGWRKVLRDHPDDVEALSGLGQTLRWQGRHAQALEVLSRARKLAPKDPDVRNQWEWARAAGAPRITPSVAYERDSDGNRVTSTRLATAFSASADVTVRADGYGRQLRQTLLPGSPNRLAGGALVAADVLTSGGWILSAGAGASGSDAPGASAIATGMLGAQSALSAPVSGGLTLARSALDATTHLVENAVVVNEGALTVATAASAPWSIRARGALARFQGTQSNQRALGQVELARRIGSWGRLAAGGTTFGFQHATSDGYWSPDFYALGELGARLMRDNGRWSIVGEAAPGLQKIGHQGDASGTFRASGRIAWSAAPGRQIGIAAGYSTSGLQSISTAGAGYRYTSIVLSGGWAF